MSAVRTPGRESPQAGLPPAIFLMGPTATGKTDLAVELVQRLPLEIVSVDSAMIYRGMDIGTAKPGADVLSVAPHRLIDFMDPAQAYSAARFQADALREMEEISGNGKIPLLVGGTMLYFRALSQGLSVLPGASAEVRTRINALAARKGWAAVHARLRGVDPAAAARIHAGDTQRVQRALEVYELTGRSMTELCAQPRSEIPQYSIAKLVLIPADRERLHARIARRFEHMVAKGLIDEVAALRARPDLNPSLPSTRAVGYRQVWEYLDGKYGRRHMVAAAVAATRGLAKRQITWLRGERSAQVFEAESSATVRLEEAIRAHGLC